MAEIEGKEIDGSADPKMGSAEPQPTEEPVKQLEIPKEKQVKPPTNKSLPVKFSFTDEAANEVDMGPVRDILSSGQAESYDDVFTESYELLTAEEVAAFLKGTYDVQGWFTYPEMWVRDPQFFYEIAVGILPHINKWASMVPAVAHAVKAVSAAGSWGRLIWDIAGTWIMVNRKRQLEAEQKLEEEERNFQNAGNPNQPTIKPGGIVIP